MVRPNSLSWSRRLITACHVANVQMVRPFPTQSRKDTTTMEDFTDVTYEVDNGLAWITINRPERYNSFRARTVDELVKSFKMAWASDEVGVICLTGAGDKAFCTGGDQKQ